MDLGFGQRKIFAALSTILLLLVIASCGGGGGGDAPPGQSPRLWGTAELIETDDAGGAFFPQVATDGAGNAMAVWQQLDDTGTHIWANYFNGTAWGTAELISETSAGYAEYPQIAMNDAGHAMAVWNLYDSNMEHGVVWANYFDGTSWGTAELIQTDAGDAGWPQIAMDSAGNAMAVWIQYDGTRDNIWANYFFDGEGWGTAGPIETSGGSAQEPQIAMDIAGNAMAVWQQSDGTSSSIWANYFNGTAWGTAGLISETSAGDAGNPDIAVDGAGNAMAVWEQDNSIRANYFDGTAWGTAELIETGNAGVGVPQIAMDSAGNAMAVWEQWGGTCYNIWANRFE